MDQQNPFKWRHYEADIILLCVRWYVRYSLSYRDLEEMMRERGLHVDHTTISRWVQRYAPELEKRGPPHLNTTNDSWRVDETYVKVKKGGCTSIAPWIRKATPWNFGSVPPAMPKQPKPSSRKRSLRLIPPPSCDHCR